MKPRQILLQVRETADSVYTRYLQRLYFGLFGHRVDRKFAIVSTARTGSNYLSGGLKTSPSVRMYHEIFADHNRQIGKNFEKTFATVFQPESQATQIVGFKVFYNHLTDEEWQKLAAYRDLKIIHLTRRNRLKTVISLEIAFRTGQWTKSSHGSDPREKRLLLDPALLMQRLEQIEAGEVATRLRFSDRPMLEVVYEDLVRSPLKGFQAIGQYLDVSDMDPAKIKLKKQNPEPLQQLISNFHEVEALLQHTRFADYLYQ
jgi:LPS sulfotransferase NodH